MAPILVAQSAYKDTMVVSGANSEHLSEYFSYFNDKANNINFKQADSLRKVGKFSRWQWHKTFNVGYTNSNYWIYIILKSTNKEAFNLLYSLYAPIDSAVWYIADTSKKGFKKISTISYLTPLLQRPYPVRSLSLPIHLLPGENKGVYLHVINYHANIYMPMDITTPEDYLLWEKNFYWHWGWYMGFFLFATILNLLLFIVLRDKIYLWYGLYVIFNMIFLLKEDMLDASLFSGGLYVFLKRLGQYPFALFAVACGIRVMQLFTNQKTYSPIFFKFLRGVFTFDIFLGIVLLLWNYFFSFHPFTNIGVKLDVVFEIFMAFSFLLIMLGLIEMMYKKKMLALYYFLSVLLLYLGFVNLLLNHIGIINYNPIRPNLITVGLAAEIILLSILLVIRYRHIFKEHAHLQFLQAEKEKEIFESVIVAQEEERKRLAQDLHDDLGATISTLKLHISNQHNDGYKASPHYRKTLELIGKAASDLREISHNLLPREFSQAGLFKVIANRIAELNNKTDTSFELITEGDDKQLDITTSVTLYRMVNELLSNIIKHSKASEATIQLLLIEGILQLIVEDNGVGLQVGANHKGIGLKNIESRVAFLNGSFTIESSNKGTSSIIEFSIHKTKI
ncbi:sensor histidine kinase [Arachidicoccus sp.]|uniref:sensor histidine kinase n=1 Tax=Arachidicoccus sp. TaxID=1872624 RepID=UPI003D230D1B